MTQDEVASRVQVLGIPRGSVVVITNGGLEGPEHAQTLVDLLRGIAGHEDFVVVDLPDPEATLEVVTVETMLRRLGWRIKWDGWVPGDQDDEE